MMTLRKTNKPITAYRIKRHAEDRCGLTLKSAVTEWGCSVNTARKHVREAIEAGYVREWVRKNDNQRYEKVYLPADIEPVTAERTRKHLTLVTSNG